MFAAFWKPHFQFLDIALNTDKEPWGLNKYLAVNTCKNAVNMSKGNQDFASELSLLILKITLYFVFYFIFSVMTGQD